MDRELAHEMLETAQRHKNTTWDMYLAAHVGTPERIERLGAYMALGKLCDELYTLVYPCLAVAEVQHVA